MRIPNLTRYQLVLEILCLVLLFGSIAAAVLAFPQLPEEIPAHFDAAGNVTDYSGRVLVFALPAINLFLYAVLTLCILFPAVLNDPNVPWEVAPAKKYIVVQESITLLSETKLLCLALFDWMLVYILRCVKMNMAGVWLLTAAILVLCALRIRRMKKLST